MFLLLLLNSKNINNGKEGLILCLLLTSSAVYVHSWWILTKLLLIKRDSVYLMSQQALGTVGCYCLGLLHGRKVEFLPSWLWKRTCSPSAFQLEKNEKIQNVWLFFTSCCLTVCLLAEEGGSNSRLEMFIAAWFPSKIIFNILLSKNIYNSAEFIEW